MKTGTMLILLLITLSFFKCSTEPPDIEPNIILTAEDASSTEVWLKLSLSGFNSNTNFVVSRNNTPIFNISSSDKDTVLYDENLLPNQSYTYKVSAVFNKEFITAETTAKTLDTTSHNFTWQTFTFGGDAGSCILRDVAIINENNIWAVGDIKIADTSANGYTTYNAIHWNGNEWELKRITVMNNGNLITPPLYGILAFSETEIWLSSGVPVKGDGNNWTQYHLFDMGILGQNDGHLTQIWGTSSSNLYYVGNLGTIAHYNGSQWTKIESGTNLNINDIWGAIDKDGKEIVLCAAYNFGSGGEKKLLKIKNGIVEEIDWVDRELYTVWFNSIDKIYAGGEGLFKRINEKWEEEELPLLFKFRVRGNALNDIWTVGGFGFCAHYNGSTWKVFEEATLSSGNYVGVAVKENIIAIAGNEGNLAVVTIGKKNN